VGDVAVVHPLEHHQRHAEAPAGRQLHPREADAEEIAAIIRAILQRAIDEDLWIIGWNIVFDIQWCIAYGCADLVHRSNGSTACCSGGT
jgi:hypothetical protein